MSRLKRAFDAEPVPRDLEAKVRARLEQPRYSYMPRLVSTFAFLLVMGAGLQYYAGSETNRLLRIGIVDHFHCAIQGAYPKQKEQTEMIQALGPYSVMLQPILSQMPGDAVVSAHRCTVNGRDYVHFIVHRGTTMVSVVMTKHSKDEFYPRTFATAFTKKTQVQIRASELDGYSVAGFTAGGYFGYVVSGLTPAENTQLAEKIAPVIRRYTGA